MFSTINCMNNDIILFGLWYALVCVYTCNYNDVKIAINRAIHWTYNIIKYKIHTVLFCVICLFRKHSPYKSLQNIQIL